MNCSALLSACLAASLVACSERTPGPTADAGAAPVQVPDAGATVEAPSTDAGPPDAGPLAGAPSAPGAGSATCSAATLSRRPQAPVPPPPPPVEDMRRRILTAAAACDYAALAKLADENGKGLRVSFGDATDPEAFWRSAEAKGEPVLARMVQVLELPAAKQGEAYYWPAVHVTHADKDWGALSDVYPEAQVRAMRQGGTGYLGLRLGISTKGDWQLAVAGD
jgi:hypothetical protein